VGHERAVAATAGVGLSRLSVPTALRSLEALDRRWRVVADRIRQPRSAQLAPQLRVQPRVLLARPCDASFLEVRQQDRDRATPYGRGSRTSPTLATPARRNGVVGAALLITLSAKATPQGELVTVIPFTVCTGIFASP